ncbi:MAG: cell division protein FtsL [Candidatus Neomarinimicrobiota bacterium]
MRRHVGSPASMRNRPASGPSLTTFFFWTIFLVSVAIAYLWVYNQNDVLAVDLEAKRQFILELENNNRELQVNIDKLSQIDRITMIARNDLGMVVPPAESLIVYLQEPPP